MAAGYLNILQRQVDQFGTVTRDIQANEALDLHNKVFTNVGLMPEAWTLYAVFNSLTQSGRDAYWQVALNSAGNLTDELALAINTDRLMSLITAIGDKNSQLLAANWLDRVDSVSGVWAALKGGGSSIYNQVAGLVGGISFGDIAVFNPGAALNGEYAVSKLYAEGRIGQGLYNDYAQWFSNTLLNNFNGPGNNPNFNFGLNTNGLNYTPIGAFYESRSPEQDNATSIANKTLVLLDSQQKGLTAAQLATLDSNHDGKLSGNEHAGVTAGPTSTKTVEFMKVNQDYEIYR
jgi:hypothetical protein